MNDGNQVSENPVENETVISKTLWGRFKDIPPFIASIIAIVSACVALGTWFVGYFATKQEVQKIRCIASINNCMISRQLEQKVLYDDYVKIKCEIEQINNKPVRSDADNQKVVSLRAAAESRWEEFLAAKKKAKRLIDILNSNQVVKTDGTCME